MKPKLTLAILFFVSGNCLFAQYPCVNGISTNPANPINTQLPSKKNTFFNWQNSVYQVQPINTDCLRGSQVESPFYKTDNLEALRESKDMLWQDGWELIQRRFGLTDSNTYTTDPVPDLYFILYNKYTSTLRVLLKVCRGADYNAAKIRIMFHGTSQMKTDLLEYSRGGVLALDKVFTNTIFAAGAEYFNDNTKWFYADFPMMFDPCTCLYKSKLNIVSDLITTSQIALEGKITGDIYTQDVGGKAQIQKPGTYGWKDFANHVNGKYASTFSSIDNFLSQTQQFASNLSNTSDTGTKKQSIRSLANALKKYDFVKQGFGTVPWLKAAVSLVDVFIGGGKQQPTGGPTEVKLLPLTVNLTAKLNSTISTSNPYHNILFTNPGSKDAKLDPANYPYYNEVLGIFNLIQTPEVWWERTTLPLNDWTLYPTTNSTQRVTVDFFKFDSATFKYVLNPAAGLTIQNMRMALVTEATYAGPSAYEPPNTTTPSMSEWMHEGRDAITNEHKNENRLL